MSESGMEKIDLVPLTRKQRRVLGTLLEKAFTTPEQYPLTLKATTTGCNQKNNREPTSTYDESAVETVLDELREMGFVAVVHTEGGRAPRFRHYMRHRTTLNDRQLAILTELLLRGHQQLGELRTRAARMKAIDSQEELRAELQALLDLGLIQTNGPLERRGIEVDHALYPAGENHEPLSAYRDVAETNESAEPASSRSMHTSPPRSITPASPLRTTPDATTHDSAELRAEIGTLRGELAELRGQVETLQEELHDLRRQLGAG